MTSNNLASTKSSSKEFNIGFKELCNVVPLRWYKTITTISGKPDLNAITILSEIFYWYRPKFLIDPESGKEKLVNKFSGELWQTSYRHFEEKFTYNHQKIRRALVRLEKLGLIERIITNVKLKGQKYTNVLFIKLNIDVVNKIVGAKFQSADSKNKSQKDSFEPDPSQDSVNSKNVAPSLQECRDHMKSKTIKQDSKSRSNESNFVESKTKEGRVEDTVETQVLQAAEVKDLSQTATSQAIIPNLVDKIKAKFTCKKRVPIAELAHITEDEAYNLRLSSKREFSLHYMNKLKERLSKKYPKHGFFTRTKFLEYMSDSLTNELRQESIVNNESFRFKQDADISRIENYLKIIEESKATDKITQLRKKIAARFDNELSYKILTACKFFEKISDENVFQAQLIKELGLEEQELAKLLEEVRAVFGEQIINIRFSFSQLNKHLTESDADRPILNLGKEGTIWHKASTRLLEIYGEGFHKSWFSKLEVTEDSNENLVLKAPSEFVKNYIETNCLSRIQNSLTLFNTAFKLVEIKV